MGRHRRYKARPGPWKVRNYVHALAVDDALRTIIENKDYAEGVPEWAYKSALETITVYLEKREHETTTP